MIKVSLLTINPQNPRIIKDEKFKKLVQSIKDFPEMLDKRPIIVNKDFVVLGGNMRLKAAIEAGMKMVPVDVADWSEEKQKEFIIKDNISGGEWDWDQLANEWNQDQLSEWGLDVYKDVNLDNFFQEDNRDAKAKKDAIILEYSPEEHERVVAAFDRIGGSREKIVWDLLKL